MALPCDVALASLDDVTPRALWEATSCALRGAIAVDAPAARELRASSAELRTIPRTERAVLVHAWCTSAMLGALANMATTGDLDRLARLLACTDVMAVEAAHGSK